MSEKKVHLIAIGGVVMHNLAIDLLSKGYHVSGSDDEIFEPSRSTLAKHQLLPEKIGWFPEKITPDLEAVILGMHARADNPELLKAQELGIPIYSFPEYVYKQSEDKQRLVVTGSHGKTTITAMIMHVLKEAGREFDYLVGSHLNGFDTMLKLSNAPVIVIEGDEYLSSAIDPSPKFLHYHHHIGVMSGLAWDHINVFPTFESYVAAFDKFADATPKAGALIYFQDDEVVSVICAKERADVLRFEYRAHPHKILDGRTYLLTEKHGEIPLQVFGEHNMENINAARMACARLFVEDDQFYKAIQSFKGTSRRLEKIAENSHTTIFRDFAHAPSKLEATTEAVKYQFKNKTLVACLELHSYSSLNKKFLKQYKNKFKAADTAIVYFNPKALAHKKLESLDKEEVRKAFDQDNLLVYSDINELLQYLEKLDWNNKVLLMMSSGNFDGLDFNQLKDKIIK